LDIFVIAAFRSVPPLMSADCPQILWKTLWKSGEVYAAETPH
jgi:hypothetical protein